MKLAILMFSILMFSCATSQKVIPNEDAMTSEIVKDSSNQNNFINDLTNEIRKKNGAYVTGEGPRATITLRSQCSRPLLYLNGTRVSDYRTLYNLVSATQFKSVKVLLPHQAAVYGLTTSSGVILVTS